MLPQWVAKMCRYLWSGDRATTQFSCEEHPPISSGYKFLEPIRRRPMPGGEQGLAAWEIRETPGGVKLVPFMSLRHSPGDIDLAVLAGGSQLVLVARAHSLYAYE